MFGQNTAGFDYYFTARPFSCRTSLNFYFQFIALMHGRVCQDGGPPIDGSMLRNYSRVVLRLAAQGFGWGLSDWDEAPEDLILCIDQLSVLWTTFSSFCQSAHLLQLLIPGTSPGEESCLQHSLAGCYRSLLEVGFNWLDWIHSSSTADASPAPLAQLLESNLCAAMGFANAAVYSRMVETCSRWTTSCLPSVVKISIALQPTDSAAGQRKEITAHVLKFSFDAVKEVSEKKTIVQPIVPAYSARYDIFSWLGIEDSSHWPWLIMDAGFSFVPPSDVFSFLDDICIPSGNSHLLTNLLCAAANSWWRSTTPRHPGASSSRLHSILPASKTPLFLVQWCLSRYVVSVNSLLYCVDVC